MQVFVLTTGRSGSMTFAAACRYIENYTVGHETRWQAARQIRLDYPEQHIEIDNRLAWLLGPLDVRYGDNAFYVHLIRDRAAVAESYFRRRHGNRSIIRAYSRGILFHSRTTLADCEDYYDTVNANIRLFLKDKTHVQSVDLAFVERDFNIFWDRIGARGARDDALAAWRVRQNEFEGAGTGRDLLARSARKLKRVAVNLPDYLRNA